MICKRCLAGCSLPWLLGCPGQGDLLLWEVGEQGFANCKLVTPNENPPKGTGRGLPHAVLNKSIQSAWLGFFCALTMRQQPRLALYRFMVAAHKCGEILGGWHPAQPRQGL